MFLNGSESIEYYIGHSDMFVHKWHSDMEDSLMKTSLFVAVVLLPLFAMSQTFAADVPANVPTQGKTNTICPISGQPVNPAITMEYEGLTWSFAADSDRAQFKAARDKSLYQRLG